MHSISTIISAAVLLAPTVLGMGVASVYNNCGMAVYYKTISGSEEAYQEIPAGGLHEQYGAHVSIKLFLNNSQSHPPISQFEYSLGGGKIFYDISNIDGDPNSPEGYPFAKGGMDVTPSVSADSANPTCQKVDCPAGTLVCTAAYNAWDDPKTMVCDQETNLVMTLCPGGAKKRSFHSHRHGQVQRREVRHPRQFK